MNTEDREPLQFRGQDANECEDFIAAIIKCAFSQGKQRDDQWMADFAATCMVNDALRWWSALDDEVQGSWKLLRRAMLLKYRPKFYGESGAEAERFVRSIVEKAADEGKQADNKWIVSYAELCLAGKALRWYSSIDSDTRGSWEKLRQAILVQYPRDPLDGPPPKLVPTPAAAASAAPAPTAPRRGRIRVSRIGSATRYYLSSKLDHINRLTPTTSIGDALEVEWNPDPIALHRFSIPRLQLPGYDMLGMRWDLRERCLGICAVNSQTNSTHLKGFPRRLLTDAWRLSPQAAGSDRAIAVSAMDGQVVLHPMLGDTGMYVWFAPKENYPTDAAEMFLEPI